MSPPHRSRLLWALAAPLAIAAAGHAEASPKAGSGLPGVTLVDAWDRSKPAKDFAGRAVIVFYEDKESGKTTQALKDELKKLSMPDGSALPLTVVPVADVTEYDYWPARGFVKDAVKKESKKSGITIFVDFDGATAKGFEAKHGEATVVVYGKDGKVLASRSGALSAKDRQAIIDAVTTATS